MFRTPEQAEAAEAISCCKLIFLLINSVVQNVCQRRRR